MSISVTSSLFCHFALSWQATISLARCWSSGSIKRTKISQTFLFTLSLYKFVKTRILKLIERVWTTFQMAMQARFSILTKCEMTGNSMKFPGHPGRPCVWSCLVVYIKQISFDQMYTEQFDNMSNSRSFPARKDVQLHIISDTSK